MGRRIAMFSDDARQRASWKVILLAFCAVATVGADRYARAQCANINAPETVVWVNSLVASALGEDQACRTGAPDRDSLATSKACNIFVGRVMARIYGLSDFVGPDHSFLKANNIAASIPTWKDWVDLGTADDQNALKAAADAANLGYVVIAVWANPTSGKPGHVALIGPGPLTTSNAWGGLRTPVAAAFALDDVEHAFLGQPLACAFGSSKKNTTHLWKYVKTVSPR